MSNINIGFEAYLKLRESLDEVQAELAKTQQHYYDMRNERDYLNAVFMEIINAKTLEQAQAIAKRTHESHD